MDIINYIRNKRLKQEFATHLADYTNYKDSNNLKVSKVEKDINDYQATMAIINPNQEVKQKVSGYGVVSLPKNAANGQVSASVRGHTWTNLISGVEVAPSDSRSFDSIDGHIYFDLHNGAIITGDGTEKTVTNASEETSNMAVFDLTQIYGQGNEPTAEQARTRLHYISGTKSTVSASRLKSAGKNLFDGKVYGKMSDGGIVDGRNIYKLEHGFGQFWSFKGEIDTRYTVSFDYKYVPGLGATQLEFLYSDGSYDKGSNLVALVSETWTNRKTTSTAGKTVIGFRQTYSNTGITYFDKDTFMLNEGTTATPYEPYTESNAYVVAKDSEGKIGELRSLPNGVKDEVNVTTGVKTQRVSDEVVFDGGSGFVSHALLDNVRVFKIENWATGKNILTDTLGSMLATSYDGDYSSLGSHPTDARGIRALSSGWLMLHVEASKIDAQSGITVDDKLNEYLNQYPITLTYQLATPIEIPIQTSGSLVSYPSGTIYVEPVVADAGIYDNGINVLHQDLPIDYLEKLSKVDFTTGLETQLDVSKAVIASDRKSFTHPNLVNGDIIFFTYFHNVEGTQGELSLEYYDSRYILKDDVTGRFYKVVPKVSNGVLSNTLVEV